MQGTRDFRPQAFHQAKNFPISEFSGRSVQRFQQTAGVDTRTHGMEAREHIPLVQCAFAQRLAFPVVRKPWG